MTTLSPAAAGPTMSPAGLFRILVSAALAVIITAGLFLLMVALIHDDAAPAPHAPPTPQIDISFDIADRDPVRDPPQEIAPVEPPPPLPSIRRDTQTAPGVEPVSLGPPPIEYTVGAITPPMVTFTIPQLTDRVEPVYPQRELSRGIEGACTIQYDILASGRTANLQVLACDSDGFARASLAAVSRWTHAMEVGRPGGDIVRRGVQTQLDYRLE